MDEALLQAYNRELEYLRVEGAEFAAQHPNVAEQLLLHRFTCDDPHVERILEGVAFLTARLQREVSDAIPRLGQHLLEAIFPDFLAPTPSMGIVQLTPSEKADLKNGYVVPRGTMLRQRLIEKDGRVAPGECRFRTAHPVTLWPVRIVEARYLSVLGDLPLPSGLPEAPRAALHLRLGTTSKSAFGDLGLARTPPPWREGAAGKPPDHLPVFIRSVDAISGRLYQQLMTKAIATIVRPTAPIAGSAAQATWQGATVGPLGAVGLSDDEALLPAGTTASDPMAGRRSVQPLRLLQEYFALPSRFMAFDLTGLCAGLAGCPANEIDVYVLLSAVDQSLVSGNWRERLALFTTPVINLFSKPGIRIDVGDDKHEHRIVPDAHKPDAFEVYAVTSLTAVEPGRETAYRPFYTPQASGPRAPDEGFFAVERRAAPPSRAKLRELAPEGYTPSELFVTLVDHLGQPASRRPRELAVTAWVTNGTLAGTIRPVRVSESNFDAQGVEHVAGVRLLDGPTPTRSARAHGDVTWKLVDHLSPHYIPFAGEDANEGAVRLRQLLALYAHPQDEAAQRQLEGIVGVVAEPQLRRVRLEGGGLCFVQGTQVKIMVAEENFAPVGPYLLGAVLERLFRRSVAINSFCETLLMTKDGREVGRWQPTVGHKALL